MVARPLQHAARLRGKQRCADRDVPGDFADWTRVAVGVRHRPGNHELYRYQGGDQRVEEAGNNIVARIGNLSGDTPYLDGDGWHSMDAEPGGE